MAGEDKGGRLKSAYELALERMESQGIERPDAEGLDADRRSELAEIRSKTEARIAELEILHRDRLRKAADPSLRAELEEEYVRERRRLEDERDRRLERVRQGRG